MPLSLSISEADWPDLEHCKLTAIACRLHKPNLTVFKSGTGLQRDRLYCVLVREIYRGVPQLSSGLLWDASKSVGPTTVHATKIYNSESAKGVLKHSRYIQRNSCPCCMVLFIRFHDISHTRMWAYVGPT